MFRPALIVHGGAGVAPTDVAAVRAGCLAAVGTGWQLLRDGGGAVDAVCAAVVYLEDHPSFNAGRGSCLTSAGTVEMDASIMDGRTLGAGAAAVVCGVRNPVRLARAIMDDGRHVMFAGPAAAEMARRHGLEMCDPQDLVTDPQQQRWRQHAAHAGGDVAGPAGATVGAVAVDAAGHVAAATSTGGVFFKLPGRVGDSAVIGAGTYADDTLGAASATGLGEAIMRIVLAHRVVAALRDGGEPAAVARAGINQLAQRTGATGGVILIDPRGRIGYAKNAPHMTVGYMHADLAAVAVDV